MSRGVRAVFRKGGFTSSADPLATSGMIYVVTIMLVRGFGIGLCVAVLAAASASSVFAQDPVFGKADIDQNRAYFLRGNETVDTLSGQVILNYTDFQLPGNAGRSLRFGRYYNGLGWSGIGALDLPMEVQLHIDQGYNTWAKTGDGVFHRAVVALDGACPGCRLLDNLWILDKDEAMPYRWWWPGCAGLEPLQIETLPPTTENSSVVYLPDGTVNRFEMVDIFSGRLRTSTDPFGNTVTVCYPSATETVFLQTVGNGRAPRRVFLERPTSLPIVARIKLDDDLASPATLTWTYSRETASSPLVVTSPEGSTWRYIHEQIGAEAVLKTIENPFGGSITYDHGWHEFNRTDSAILPCNGQVWDPETETQPAPCPVNTRVVTFRHETGVNQPWIYRYDVADEGTSKTINEVESPTRI